MQNPFITKDKSDQQAAHPSIAIKKGMDCLKLRMNQAYF